MNWHRLPTPEAHDPFPAGLYRSPFRPAWWLRNAHAQTLFSPLFRKPPQLHRERERISLPDGDWLYLDWLLPEAWAGSGRPLVLVVHGLTGSSDSLYVLGLQEQLRQMGWGSVAMNCRGAVGPNHLPRAYHAGASDDIRAALDTVAARHPGHPLAVAGYSLGGNMTLKLLAELGEDRRVFAGVAVSVPLLMGLCANRMDRGFSRVYRRKLIGELLTAWEGKVSYQLQQGQPEAASLMRRHLDLGPFDSFWSFDDKLMAPLHGFADVHDYYARCSSRQFLKDIRIPTLVIHAVDDPFMEPGVIPGPEELSAQVHFELSQQGGHVGFVDGGRPGVPGYYLERRIPQFLQEKLTLLSKPLTTC